MGLTVVPHERIRAGAGVLAGIFVGAGFQGVEYSYDIIAPQIQGSFNHFFNALNSGNFVR